MTLAADMKASAARVVCRKNLQNRDGTIAGNE